MSLNYRGPVVLSAILALTAQTVMADLVKSTPAQIEKELRWFNTRTKLYMTSRGMRVTGKRRPVQFRPRFEGRQAYRTLVMGGAGNLPDAIRSAPQVRGRDEARKTKEPFDSYNQAKNLVDVQEFNLKSMDQNALTAGKVAVAPWSDTYWPIYAGVTSARYAIGSSYISNNWKNNRDYVYQNSCDPDNLSPAEKYDALVGLTINDEASLAREQAEEGKPYADSNGNGVESWMGICHGWSPAAFELPRPQKAVTVKAANGASLRFYPSDIKGMSSLLWANARVRSNFIGRRCEEKSPAVDSATGRIEDEVCRDVNPGAWHLSVVNQVGKAKKSFVLDATYSYEVWNQPIKAYSYTYFNPQTGKPVEKLKDAAVKVKDFKNDKFAKYRGDKAKYVVGVNMDLEYVVETYPTHDMTNAEAQDATTTASFMYDLELDKDGNIVGGEWYTNDHPDFLWVPSEGRAVSYEEQQLEAGPQGDEIKAWDPRATPVPAALQQLAPKKSRRGLPLGIIVEKLGVASNL